MHLENIESRLQTTLESVASAGKTVEYLASKMRSNNDIDAGGLIGILAQGRKILDECERLKAICDALTYEETEETDD